MTDFDQASWASSGLTNAAVESSRESKRTCDWGLPATNCLNMLTLDGCGWKTLLMFS